jgi:hypothetical protein
MMISPLAKTGYTARTSFDHLHLRTSTESLILLGQSLLEPKLFNSKNVFLLLTWLPGFPSIPFWPGAPGGP